MMAKASENLYTIALIIDCFFTLLGFKDYWKISEENGENYAVCDCCYFMNMCGSCVKEKGSRPDFDDILIEEPYSHVGFLCPHMGEPFPKEEDY